MQPKFSISVLFLFRRRLENLENKYLNLQVKTDIFVSDYFERKLFVSKLIVEL